jgi:small membrane protein
VNWIQGLLIASIIALLVYLLRSRRSVQSQAWVKVAFLFFVLAGVYAVLRPNDTTVVAHWLGVDRGTDLMLYALIIGFTFSTLSTYLRFKDLEVRYARLARAIAIDGAQPPE